MLINFDSKTSMVIEQEIRSELNRYMRALKRDEEFIVLKQIREKIKKLEHQKKTLTIISNN